jgi:hypothetical protein
MSRSLQKTRLEGDSTTAGDIQPDVTFPGGYLDGNYVTVPALHKRFPDKRIITYTVNGSTSGADLIDCEAGDATPPLAAKYVHDERAKKHWPGIYTPLAELADVCHALKALGLGPDVPIQTAHYTGHPHLCNQTCFDQLHLVLPFKPLIVATQYATQGIGTPLHEDLSLVADYWPGIDPAPAPHHGSAPLAHETSAALLLVENHFHARVAAGQALPANDQADRTLVRNVAKLCEQVLGLT